MQFVALHIFEIMHVTAFVEVELTEDSPASVFSTDPWFVVFFNFEFSASRFIVSISACPVSFGFSRHCQKSQSVLGNH